VNCDFYSYETNLSVYLIRCQKLLVAFHSVTRLSVAAANTVDIAKVQQLFVEWVMKTCIGKTKVLGLQFIIGRVMIA